MHRGADRADQLARRLLAVHAGHRLEQRAALGAGRRLVAVDADPVHLAAGGDLLAADDRDVVLGLAGDGAGVAADAGVEVDRHAPRHGRRGAATGRGRARRAAWAARRCRRARRRARGSRPCASNSCWVTAKSWRAPVACRVTSAAPLVGRAQHEGVVADAGADAPGAPAALAEGQRRHLLGVAGQHPHRREQAAPAGRGAHHVAGGQAQARRGARAELQRVVPGELGEGLRQLLQPAEVGVAAVAHRRVGQEHRGERGGGAAARRGRGAGGGRRRRGGSAGVRRGGVGGRSGGGGSRGRRHGSGRRLRRPGRPHRLEGAAGDAAAAQAVVPEGLEGGVVGARRRRAARRRLAPVAAQQGAAVAQAVGGEQGVQLGRRAAVVERRDGRLQQRRAAVVGERVAPALLVVRERQVPVAQRRRLVGVEAGVDAQPGAAERLRHAERGGRLVGRVGADDDERADRAGVERPRQLGQSAGAGGGVGRLDQLEGAADGAEPQVEGERVGVRRRRQAAAGEHQRVGAGGLQRLHGAALERRLGGVGGRRHPRRPSRQPVRRDARQQRLDARRRQGDAPVGAGAEQARRDLGGERQRQRARLAAGGARRRPVHRLAHRAGAVGERVGGERQHAARAVEPRQRRQLAAEGAPRALGGGGIAQRRVHDPARARVAPEQRGEQGALGRRGERPGEDVQPRAVERAEPRRVAAPGGLEIGPVRRRRLRRRTVARPAEALAHGARAVGVPQLEHGSLRPGVGGAQARRVQRVALDLDRPALARADQHAVRMAVAHHRAGVVQPAARRCRPRACAPTGRCGRSAARCRRRRRARSRPP